MKYKCLCLLVLILNVFIVNGQEASAGLKHAATGSIQQPEIIAAANLGKGTHGKSPFYSSIDIHLLARALP